MARLVFNAGDTFTIGGSNTVTEVFGSSGKDTITIAAGQTSGTVSVTVAASDDVYVDPTSTKAIFDHSVELNAGQVSTDGTQTLQTLLESGMGQQLHDLGINKVVAQFSMPPVEVLGVSTDDATTVFDLDILLNKSGRP